LTNLFRGTALVALAACLLASIALAPGASTLDERLFLAINRRHGPPIVEPVFRITSHLGLLPVNLAIWVAAWRFGPHPGFALRALAGLAVVWAACRLIKAATRRVRPHAAIDSARLVGLVPSGSSFPSSHAALALYTGSQVGMHVTSSVAAWLALIALAGLVGYIRVYLGAHYPRDVLAGFALGALGALGVELLAPSIYG
jgi:undecaprenyl-diphosphatase